jgi:ABC-type sugar transport system substrate-binding protein
MRSVRRWALYSLALALVLALVTAGCGSSSSSSSDSSTAATSGAEANGEASETGEGEASEGAGAPAVQFTGMEATLPTTVTEPKAGDVKIAMLSPAEENETVHYRSAALEAAVEQLGGTATIYDAKLDPDTQVSQAEQAIAAGTEAIVIEAVDPGAVTPILKAAEAADVPVVGVDVNLDSPALPKGYAGQILTGRTIRSYLAAKTAAELLSPGAKVGLIGFAIPVPSVERTVEEDRKYAEKFGLEVVGETKNPSDEIAGGEKAMTEMISQNPDVEGILAYNDNSAVGAAAAARAAGKSGLVLIGNNGEQIGIGAVAEGKIAATIQSEDVESGKQMGWMAVDLARGVKTPPSVFAGEAVAVTSENVDQIESWEEILQREFGG